MLRTFILYKTIVGKMINELLYMSFNLHEYM